MSEYYEIPHDAIGDISLWACRKCGKVKAFQSVPKYKCWECVRGGPNVNQLSWVRLDIDSMGRISIGSVDSHRGDDND